LGAKPREVDYLAKVMELKFALAGPSIGGGKSAIDFDPRDPRKHDVLCRWYRAIAPYLRAHYGTGGDLNVDEVTEVVPIFRELGLAHPQEGVVRGHLQPDEDRFRSVIRTLDEGVGAPVTGSLGVEGHTLAVADTITGYGVARAVVHYRQRLGLSMDGVRVVLEGFGNVGAPAGLYLARAGARVVAIADAEKTIVQPDGMDADEVARLLTTGPLHLLPDDDRCLRGDDHDAYLDVPADVFVCAASSGTLTSDCLDRMERAGVTTIVAGANLPFREQQAGAVEVHRSADERFAVLPDFVVNLGMARGFSYFMEEDAEPRAEPVFAAVDATVEKSVRDMLERAHRPDRGLMAASLDLALDRIGAP
jgi:glutamate dehydrogenase/leucine dehydrogenase